MEDWLFRTNLPRTQSTLAPRLSEEHNRPSTTRPRILESPNAKKILLRRAEAKSGALHNLPPWPTGRNDATLHYRRESRDTRTRLSTASSPSHPVPTPPKSPQPLIKEAAPECKRGPILGPRANHWDLAYASDLRTVQHSRDSTTPKRARLSLRLQRARTTARPAPANRERGRSSPDPNPSTSGHDSKHRPQKLPLSGPARAASSSSPSSSPRGSSGPCRWPSCRPSCRKCPPCWPC